MHGTRKAYTYFLCRQCGCMQLAQPVAQEEQYPSSYYAFHPQPRPTGVRLELRRLRNKGVFSGSVLGRLLNVVFPYPVYGADRWFPQNGIDTHSRILDVGCGSAELIRDLVEVGFLDAHGIDPFLPEDVMSLLPSGVRRAWLHEWRGEYDLVMLHHVFEHMADPDAALRDVARLLRAGGLCLLRIPLMPNHAWESYGANWVQIDAPRHFFLHTTRSLLMIAERAGLRLERMWFDSTAFQFIGSELYARDLALSELPAAYSRAEIRRFTRRAYRLNAAGRGDQAAFVFRKA